MKPALLSSRYYLKFGLDRDPFPARPRQSKVFLSHELNQLIHEVCEAIKTQSGVLLLESQPGGGKTTLAGYLNYVKQANWYVSQVQARPEMSRLELAHAIISQHFPRHRFDKTQADTLLREFLQLYQRNGKLPVVLIDDAHLLSQDTLKFVLQISVLCFEQTQFRMVLFTDKSIRGALALPSLTGINSSAHVFREIPVFSQLQTAKYLEHRLALAGKCGFSPFTAASVTQIFQQSAGLPAAINRLAREYMKGFVIPGQHRRVLKRTVAALAASLLLIVGVYAGIDAVDNDKESADAVSISLSLPGSEGVAVTAGTSAVKPLAAKHDKAALQKRQAPARTKTINRQVLQETKDAAQHNKQVLQADRQRQIERRARKLAYEKEKVEIRMQLARYDQLALRVSEVVQH